MYNENDEFKYEPTSFEPLVVEEKKSGKPRGLAAKIIALSLCCALLGGIVGGGAVGYTLSSILGVSVSDIINQDSSGGTSASGTSSSGTDKMIVTTNNDGTEKTYSEIYNENCKAIVGIATESTSVNIFGQYSTTASSGTGFIISSDGYIMTNNHVVADSNTVTVTLYDETTYQATIVGTDSDNDIALIKIDATGLSTVDIGNSDNIVVGESVMAIGNPLGELTYTLTTGVVSALDREINIDGTPINMFQVDVAINPGNSGGPLFDMYGNVIGITTAKYSDTGVEGLGFAIPINDAVSIATELKENGYVKGKPSFGIVVQDIYGNVQSYYNLPAGVYVYTVNSGSCAETAGIKVGDIITSIDDTEITSTTELAVAKKSYKAGDTVKIGIYRDGQSTTVSLTFDEEKPTTTTSESTTGNSSTSGNSSNQYSNSSPFESIYPSTGSEG